MPFCICVVRENDSPPHCIVLPSGGLLHVARTSSSRMLTPATLPDNIDGVHITLDAAVGSCTFELPQIILHLCR